MKKMLFCMILMMPLIFTGCLNPPTRSDQGIYYSIKQSNEELNKKIVELQKEIKLFKSSKEFDLSKADLIEKVETFEKKYNDVVSTLHKRNQSIRHMKAGNERLELEFMNTANKLMALQKRNADLNILVEKLSSYKIKTVNKRGATLSEAVISVKKRKETVPLQKPKKDPKKKLGKKPPAPTQAMESDPVKKPQNDKSKQTPTKKKVANEVKKPLKTIISKKVALDPKSKPEAIKPPKIVTKDMQKITVVKSTPLDKKEPSKSLQFVKISPTLSGEKTVVELLPRWKEVWEKKDFNTYIGFYSSRFKGRGMNLKAWHKYKNSNFHSKKNIKIKITDIKTVKRNNGDIVVKFIQYYNADKYSDTGLKTLRWSKTNDGWKIISESWRPKEARLFHGPKSNAGEEKQPKMVKNDIKKPAQTVKTKSVPSEEKTVVELLPRWKEVWEKKDINSYTGFYSYRFKARGMNFYSWSKYKTNNFQSIKNITIILSDIKTRKRNNGDIVVKFIQHYTADHYSDTGFKTLRWTKESDGWKIISESWRPKEEKFPTEPKSRAEKVKRHKMVKSDTQNLTKLVNTILIPSGEIAVGELLPRWNEITVVL